jgi:hypothetical protein
VIHGIPTRAADADHFNHRSRRYFIQIRQNNSPSRLTKCNSKIAEVDAEAAERACGENRFHDLVREPPVPENLPASTTSDKSTEALDRSTVRVGAFEKKCK